MAYFQGKVAFRQLIFGGYLVAITRILGYNTHRWMLIVYLELFTLKYYCQTFICTPTMIHSHPAMNNKHLFSFIHFTKNIIAETIFPASTIHITNILF